MLHALAVAGVLASGLVATNAAYASDAECVPSEGTPAVFGDWARASFTEWQPTDARPADPDGQSGPSNPLNLMQIGEREETVPGTTSVVEITDWRRDLPAGAGWSVNETRVVTDKLAYDEPVSQAVDQWYHWNGGNQATAPAPPPAAGWGTDNGNHNGLMNKSDYAPNKVFDASKLGAKEASWFFHGLHDAVIKHHDAVTHAEYRYERQVETQGDVLYRWSVEHRTYTKGTDPVTCDEEQPPAEGGGEEPGTPPTDTPDENTPSVPTEVKGQTAQTPSSAPHAPAQLAQSHTPAANPPAVPLSIDAGL